MWSPAYWRELVCTPLNQNTIHLQRFTKDHVEAGAATNKTKDGWFLSIPIYIIIFLRQQFLELKRFLLGLNDPRKIMHVQINRNWYHKETYEKYVRYQILFSPDGAIVKGWHSVNLLRSRDDTCAVATCKLNTLSGEYAGNTGYKHVKLERFSLVIPYLSQKPNLHGRQEQFLTLPSFMKMAEWHLAYIAMSED